MTCCPLRGADRRGATAAIATRLADGHERAILLIGASPDAVVEADMPAADVAPATLSVTRPSESDAAEVDDDEGVDDAACSSGSWTSLSTRQRKVRATSASEHAAGCVPSRTVVFRELDMSTVVTTHSVLFAQTTRGRSGLAHQARLIGRPVLGSTGAANYQLDRLWVQGVNGAVEEVLANGTFHLEFLRSLLQLRCFTKLMVMNQFPFMALLEQRSAGRT